MYFLLIGKTPLGKRAVSGHTVTGSNRVYIYLVYVPLWLVLCNGAYALIEGEKRGESWRRKNKRIHTHLRAHFPKKG